MCSPWRHWPRCTLDNIAAFEVSVQKHLVAEAKVPMGWEEVLFTTDAALPVTIVNAWARHTAGQVTAAGYGSEQRCGVWPVGVAGARSRHHTRVSGQALRGGVCSTSVLPQQPTVLHLVRTSGRAARATTSAT